MLAALPRFETLKASDTKMVRKPRRGDACSSVNRLAFISIPLRGDGLYSFLEEVLGRLKVGSSRSGRGVEGDRG
jgi:hypothetical protein